MNVFQKSKTYVILDWKRYLKRNEHPITESFLNSHGTEVYKYAINAIRESLLTNTDEVSLFAIKSSIFMSVVKRNEYGEFLQSALSWLIECEEYEMCAEIKNILDTM